MKNYLILGDSSASKQPLPTHFICLYQQFCSLDETLVVLLTIRPLGGWHGDRMLLLGGQRCGSMLNAPLQGNKCCTLFDVGFMERCVQLFDNAQPPTR